MAPSLKQDAQPFQKHVAMQNINQENDTENVPVHFTNDDALFKTAGELEVDDSSSYSDSDSVSEMKSPICKKLKTFSQEIPSSVIDKFAALYQLLILKLPLDLWKLVSASLSRKRFMQIKSMFHLVNNREFRNNSSKMSKVPPIYNIFALIQYRIFCTF